MICSAITNQFEVCESTEFLNWVTGFAHEHQQPNSLAEMVVLLSVEGDAQMFLLEPGKEKHGALELNRYLSDIDDEEVSFIGIYKRIKPSELR